MRHSFTAEEVRRHLIYDPISGVFYRRISSGTAKAGDIAGSLDKDSGYRRLSLAGKLVYEHHAAWVYVHSQWPKDGLEIDHINGCRSHNWIANLREATRAQNCVNSLSRSGRFRGVTWDGVNRKWRAKIAVSGKHFHLGRYLSEEEAARAYDAAVQKYYGPFHKLNLGDTHV